MNRSFAIKPRGPFAYGLEGPLDDPTLVEMADPWRPHRMWACVLLRAWAGRRTAMGGSRDAGERRLSSRTRAARRSAPR